MEPKKSLIPKAPALHPILSLPGVIKLVSVVRMIQRPLMRMLKPRRGYYLFAAPKRQVKPISVSYGFDRGKPVDRYYIEAFMEKYESDVKGVCLEITDNAYTVRYGKNRVTKSEVLDINQGNKQANIYGDLQSIPQIPDNTYDCVILTQTILMIPDYEAAIRESKRILKPGGILLVTLSTLSPVWNIKYHMWRFTGASANYIFSKYFDKAKLTVETWGNALSGQAFWVGMAVEDLTKKELEHNDPYFPVIVTIRAQK